MVDQRVWEKLAALIARTESPFVDEARTSALLAIQLMKKHRIVPESLMKLAQSLQEEKRLRELRKKPLSKTAFAVRGGRAGGKARAAKLTPEQRSAIARKAALARWSRKPRSQHHIA